MPYKYIKSPDEIKEPIPKVTETKELTKQPEHKDMTEEEHQIQTVKENADKFFDEDDEIIEVNWD